MTVRGNGDASSVCLSILLFSEKIRRSCKRDITCVPFEFPNVQFESASLVAQPEVSVLGESGAAFVVPKVHPQDPGLTVFGQGGNFVETKPVVL